MKNKSIPFLFFILEDIPQHRDMLDKNYKIIQFQPTMFSLNEHKSYSLIYIMWFIFTLGKYKIFYIKNSHDEVIHIAHVLPKFFKFPFMGNNDLEIGPCWTASDYRGQGIYPSVLQYISLEEFEENRKFFMMIHPQNSASINGVLKAGFKKYGRGYKSSWLGIYILGKK